MSDIIVNRWKRYGHDRAYEVLEDGTKLGWMNLATGEITIEEGADAVATAAALRSWNPPGEAGGVGAPQAAVPTVTPAPAPVVEEFAAAPVPAPVVEEPEPDMFFVSEPVQPPAPEWTDLAQNQAGAMVRQQALDEWQARKERSKFTAYSARLLNLHTDERAWRVGADGEERVGPKLEKLRQHGWHVLHSVPVGKGDSDIDHVLIGPGGVFTVNTKNHPGKKVWVASRQIRVNGTVVPYLRNSRHEGTRAAKLLSAAAGYPVPVMPALVILTGGLQPDVTYKSHPDDVLVCDAWDVPRVFKRKKGVLTAEEVTHVFDLARRSTTWH